MTDMLHIARREMKLGFRNPWAYSFLVLFAAFSLSLLIINMQSRVQGYSAVTGSMLSLTLYLLPLMTLFIGSFSLTSEKEEGSWQLLSTYPLGTLSFVLGKYAGLAAVLLVIVAFGYGLMGFASGLLGIRFEPAVYFLFLAFSAGLVLLFLALALVVGSLCRNRWQALTASVAIWFAAVIGWPSFLLALLGSLPYSWIQPLLTVLTILNPAELVRLFVVIRLGGGAAFGPEYYQWVEWVRGPSGGILFAGTAAVWALAALTAVYAIWERGRSRG